MPLEERLSLIDGKYKAPCTNIELIKKNIRKHRYPNGNHCWHSLWKCHCGKEFIARNSHITTRGTKSCGCSWSTHGMSRASEHAIWSMIIQRCCNPKQKAFPRYGGRGILICDKWKNDFQQFYKDMGPRPSKGHSIDRIDNNKNYEPSNCRWATAKEQSVNSSIPKLVTFNGKTQNLSEWARELKVDLSRLCKRIKKLPLEEAMSYKPIPRK